MTRRPIMDADDRAHVLDVAKLVLQMIAEAIRARRERNRRRREERQTEEDQWGT